MTRESTEPAASGSINAGISSLVRSRQAAATAAQPSSTRQISLDDIDASPYQPPGRRAPTSDEVLSLADDLLARGQLMNIIVRPKGDRFELMGGERRFCAFQLNRQRAAPDRRAAWETIRAEVRDASDAEAADIVAVENLQREQLTDLDEAFTYAQLMDLHQFTQAKQLADHLKRPMRTVQRLLQIHRAPGFIKEAMTKGLLVQAGEGEGATKTHRRLDKEQVLVFVRLHEFFAKQLDPRTQREVEEARAAIVAAKEEVAAADEAAKDAARRRLEKAQVGAEKAARGVERETERRAQARVTGAIQRALMEGWSYRRLDAFYKSCTELAGSPASSVAMDSAGTAGDAGPGGTSGQGALFSDEGGRLVVRRDRLARAGAEEKARLASVLRGLLEQLVATRASVNVDAA